MEYLNNPHGHSDLLLLFLLCTLGEYILQTAASREGVVELFNDNWNVTSVGYSGHWLLKSPPSLHSNDL